MGENRLVSENGLPVIGVYPISNTGSIVVHTIEDNRVQFSLNGGEPEWAPITEEWVDTDEDYMGETLESCFRWGSFLIPFSKVMRV